MARGDRADLTRRLVLSARPGLHGRPPLVAVAGTSFKDFAVSEIDELQSADYLMVSTGGTIDPELVSRLEDVPDAIAAT